MTQYVSGSFLKVGKQYVCWDSYKAKLFLGPKRIAELFPWVLFNSNRTRRWNTALAMFPTAQIILHDDGE